MTHTKGFVVTQLAFGRDFVGQPHPSGKAGAYSHAIVLDGNPSDDDMEATAALGHLVCEKYPWSVLRSLEPLVYLTPDGKGNIQHLRLSRMHPASFAPNNFDGVVEAHKEIIKAKATKRKMVREKARPLVDELKEQRFAPITISQWSLTGDIGTIVTAVLGEDARVEKTGRIENGAPIRQIWVRPKDKSVNGQDLLIHAGGGSDNAYKDIAQVLHSYLYASADELRMAIVKKKLGIAKDDEDI